jgi:septal ring-binding cell division protein DamX/type II secretory pathway predicted ATPase ExeA
MNTPNETMHELMINPNYWRRYGFSRDPFSANTQKEHFVPDSWEEYLDLLPQFARFCDTLLLIIGRPKVGKTTLINLFTNEQANDTDIFALRASDCSSANHFLQLLNQRFGAPYDANNPAPASEQLHQQLDYLRENKASRLLIIDEAEKLPLDMRQLCLQIIQQQNALTTCLPIILVGENNLSDQMHALLTPTTAQKCLYTIHIEPFSEDETEQYLQWCCAQAAGDKTVEFPFEAEDIATIFQNSQGVIGDINPIAQQLLSSRTKAGITLPPYLRGKVLWWSGAIIIITILLIAYQQLTKPSALDAMVTAPASTTTPAPAPVANTPTPAPAPTPPPPTTPPATATPTNSTEPSNTAQGASSEDLPHTDATAADTATKLAPIVPVPVPLPTHAAAAQQEPVAKPNTSNKVNKTAATNLFNTTMTEEMHAHQTQVMHTPPNHYTLQLIASPNLHVVQKFIIKHQLGSVAMIVPTEREGKFNYIVLYGNFPTQPIAAQAQARLQQTKQIKAWLRTYKSVQELIKPVKTAEHKTAAKKVAHKKAEQSNNSENW